MSSQKQLDATVNFIFMMSENTNIVINIYSNQLYTSKSINQYELEHKMYKEYDDFINNKSHLNHIFYLVCRNAMR